jgi:hypothetical protein
MSGDSRPLRFVLHEPLDAASGALVTLDAWRLLRTRGSHAPRIAVSGPDVVFAPMTPRTFMEYWSSRGFMRALLAEGSWTWAGPEPGATGSTGRVVRLFPSAFDHLPDPWSALAASALLVASPAAREGFATGALDPSPLWLPEAPTAEAVAASVDALAAATPASLDRLRQELCQLVHSTGGPEQGEAALDPLVNAVSECFDRPPAAQDLGRVALMFTDRTLPLRDLAEQLLSREPTNARTVAGGARADTWPPALHATTGTSPGTLSVVVTCFDMGTLLADTVRSVWASTRVPDQLVLVDDGSTDRTTLTTIAALEREARAGHLPLEVLRTPNTGLASARNAGLAVVTGELVSFLDGDDLIEPEFYAIAVALLERRPRLGGVACWAICFSDERIEGYWNAPQAELPLLLVENTVVVPCVTRTADIRALGGYDNRQRLNYEDWELSVRLVASGRPIVTVPMYLQRYRVRAASLLRTMTAIQHQHMRETFFVNHRTTVERFSVEVAMLVEGRLAKLLHPPKS